MAYTLYIGVGVNKLAWFFGLFCRALGGGGGVGRNGWRGELGVEVKGFYDARLLTPNDSLDANVQRPTLSRPPPNAKHGQFSDRSDGIYCKLA